MESTRPETRATFEEFARADLPGLLRFAAALCADRGTAEDVVQEVLLRVQARWPDIAAMAHPDAYVRRMIVNEYLSWRRKWSRLVPHAQPLTALTPDLADRVSDRAQLVAQIARLPRKQRAVVVLRYFGGLSDQEISDELDCTLGTVRSHASRALAALRVRIENEDGENR